MTETLAMQVVQAFDLSLTHPCTKYIPKVLGLTLSNHQCCCKEQGLGSQS